MQLFSVLLDSVFPPKDRALRARSLSYEALHTLVTPKEYVDEHLTCTSLLPYKDPLVQAAITEAKYNDSHHAQRILGSILATYLSQQPDTTKIVLIPVPLSAVRLHARGYNQVDRICVHAQQVLKKEFGVCVAIERNLLCRIKDTPPQTSLGAAGRRSNMEGAFLASRSPSTHTIYVLVDDVRTSGATLLTASEALISAGAAYVRGISLAHSP